MSLFNLADLFSPRIWSSSDIITKNFRSPITLIIISKKTGKIHPATLYTLKYAGATHILALGGIQVSS